MASGPRRCGSRVHGRLPKGRQRWRCRFRTAGERVRAAQRVGARGIGARHAAGSRARRCIGARRRPKLRAHDRPCRWADRHRRRLQGGLHVCMQQRQPLQSHLRRRRMHLRVRRRRCVHLLVPRRGLRRAGDRWGLAVSLLSGWKLHGELWPRQVQDDGLRRQGLRLQQGRRRQVRVAVCIFGGLHLRRGPLMPVATTDPVTRSA